MSSRCQLGFERDQGETHSATAGPLREIVLASTTNAIAFVVARCSWNWLRMRGCPGTSMTRRVLWLDARGTTATFVCIDVCVGSVWLYANWAKGWRMSGTEKGMQDEN